MTGRDRALRITGGAQLAGDICVSGSKNAALPEMAAALLTTDRVTLHNVPRVTDSTVMAEILTALGGHSEGEDLCRLLAKMGARIEGIGTERVIVDGMSELRGAEHTVIADYLEAGTYAIAVAAAGGDLRIKCSRPEDLEVLLLKLEQAGAEVEAGDEWFRVARSPGSPVKPCDMSTLTFPGF